jgi:hypothetical protein
LLVLSFAESEDEVAVPETGADEEGKVEVDVEFGLTAIVDAITAFLIFSISLNFFCCCT